jgi:hypothetical protein
MLKLFARIMVLLLISSSVVFAGSAYYYDYGNQGGDSTVTIPTPTPSIDRSSSDSSNPSNCYYEQYVCGTERKCWDGSYDGDRSRQGMGYCFDVEKYCTRKVCR